ncbi:hypothetical protein F4779DRAFT_635335 [Xylariaceae sp. FL0662B]|nr:hypothetical protein F4779DRAFT_635335 [Xylariaceae sp. FL0662B]
MAASKLVVGIDFGTTFTGVSWYMHRPNVAPQHPEPITNWPSILQCDSKRPKVASKILYDERTGRIARWGYGVPIDAEPLEWLKIFLLDSEDVEPHLRNSPYVKFAFATMKRLGKHPVQVVADYFAKVWDHAMGQIAEQVGWEAISIIPTAVIFTVPAMWKNYARQRIAEAATMARITGDPRTGQTGIHFLTEPESAAQIILQTLQKKNLLGVGDSIVVVDAGGGTVDIVNYETVCQAPLGVAACVEGVGGLYGAAFLDEAFEAFLKMTIGDTAWGQLSKTDARRCLHDDWEHDIKPNFDGNTVGGKHGPWAVQFPIRKEYSKRKARFESDNLRPVFDGIFSRIQALIDEQINDIRDKTRRDPKYIILSGGFGRSPYMRNYLQARIPDHIKVVQASNDDPWTAVCLGAVYLGSALLGLMPELVPVISRVSRINCGILIRTPYIEGQHRIEDMEWEANESRWYAKNQFQWVMKKGQCVPLHRLQSYSFTRYIGADALDSPLEETIWTSYDSTPPSMFQSMTPLKLYIFPSLVLDELRLIENGWGPGQAFYQVDYKIRFLVDVSGLTVSVVIASRTFVTKTISM